MAKNNTVEDIQGRNTFQEVPSTLIVTRLARSFVISFVHTENSLSPTICINI